MKSLFLRWLDGDVDVMEGITDAAEVHDSTREELKKQRKEFNEEIYERTHTEALIQAKRKGFHTIYMTVSILSCVLLIGVLLFTVANLPRYGEENPRTVEVVERYVEKGLEETGAVNVVAGMILDYRAFDTLGESHVLFTALICVMILLRLDKKTIDGKKLDRYHTVKQDTYFDISHDSVMRNVGRIIIPCIVLFGIYVLLNGQNGPGGGFSGGAIMGAALIMLSTTYGFDAVDRFFTTKVLMVITFVSLAFYSFAKGYVFFTGANGLDNHIPKGIPGAILSGGLILPLDIAVGLVVACTMFGFYSLFKRGSIGSA